MADLPNPTVAFAEDIQRIGRGPLAAPDVEQVRRLVLDLLGVSIFGATMPWSRALATWAGEFRGGGAAPVVGGGFRTTPQVAALVNGSAGHGYELDDTHNASMSHPGAVIIPAVLSTAAGSGATAMQVYAAIAAGYEAMSRVGMAVNAHAVISRGFHPTSLFGAFGAAAGVGALHGFDAATLACAWGHALSLTGGSMQFSDEPAGTTVKRLHAGYGAQHGVLAAGMARAGIAAPVRALDGKYGLMALYGSGANAGHLQRAPSARLQIHDISMKPYSCCRLFHSLIDALEEVSDAFTLPLDGLERIRVRAPEVVFDQHMLRRPRSVMAAQYSLPYVVGATLAYGSRRFDAYREDFFDDPRILALADKVDGTRDVEIEKDYPARMGAAVELHFRDGARREALVMDSRGTPARPLSVEAIEAKGQALIDSAGLRFDVAAARRTLWSMTDGQALVDLFAG
ncbi:MAG TPA: MmgE/PrpD family protein [Burkholderiaceae bacterium]|nr:MmgE/PrpD family protein [Burkholderiaceae bacterium]